MGTAICETPKEKITFEKIELILKKTINDKELNHSIKNNSIVYNLYCEYYELKLQSTQQQMYQSSELAKNMNSFTPLRKLKQIFLQWFNILYDIENIEFRAANDLNRLRSENFSLENYFKNNLKKHYKNNKNFFLKLVSKGIPSRLRTDVWAIILEYEEKKDFNNSTILNSKEEKIEFINLLSQKNLYEKQISNDISRTFVNENHQTNFNMKLLKDLLIALTNLDKDLGYCQGINFIVSFILQLTNFSKYKTYHLSKLIIPKIKNYYSENFPKLYKNLKLFDTNFKYFYPKLYEHFKKNELINELFVGKWIQTLFTICVPFNELCIIWDTFLAYGFNFIVFISLAILEHTEKELLKLNDTSDIIKFLKNTLNPDKKDLKQNIYIEYENDIRKYIIPISDIISTAKKIKTNYENNKNFIDNIKISNSYNSRYKSIFDFIKDNYMKDESSLPLKSTSDDPASNKIDDNKNDKILKSRIVKKVKINRHKDNYTNENINFNEKKRNSASSCIRSKNIFNHKKENLNQLNISDNNNYNYDSNNNSIVHNSTNFKKPNNKFYSSKTINSYFNTFNTISSTYDLEKKYNNKRNFRKRDSSSSSNNNICNNENSNYGIDNRFSSNNLKFYYPYKYNYKRLSEIDDGNRFNRGLNELGNEQIHEREIPLFNHGLFRK